MARPDIIQSLKAEIAAGALASFLAPPAHAPLYLRAAHGRLDVLGALGAHAGATLAQMTLPTRLAIALQSRPDPTLAVRSDQIVPPFGESAISIPLEPVLAAAPEQTPALIAQYAAGPAQWAAPVLAMVCAIARHLRSEGRSPAASSPGLSIIIRSEIPMGAGQGSCTALLAALLTALSDFHRLALDGDQRAARVAEAHALLDGHGDTAARFIDARTCLQRRFAGDLPRLLRYSAQPHRYVGPVPLPADVRILALDTGVRYTSARTTLHELHAAGAMGFRLIETIYRDLGQDHTPLHGYLANTSPLLYRQYFRTLLPKRMRGSDFLRTYPFTPVSAVHPPLCDPAGLYRIRTAVDHLIAEHEHAEQFLQAMEELAEAPSGAIDESERQRILQRAGRLLLASHHSYRLRLELSCREADWLVDHLMEAGPERGVFGARITGAGGGGTLIALLARTSPATDALLATMKAYSHLTGLVLGITEA